MTWVTEYLLSITVAAVLCVVVKSFIIKNGAIGNIISGVTGIFMLITVLSPLINSSFQNLEEYFEDFSISGEMVAADAVNNANAEMATIIKQRVEAYILEEADEMSITVSAEVELTDENPPVPYAVYLTAEISPYKKNKLSQYISDNFDIPQERIIWN